MEYKTAKYSLWKIIREAQQQNKQKLEGHYSTADARRIWKAYKIMDYKGTTMEIRNTLISLPEKLNKLYSSSKTLNSETQRRLSHTQNMHEMPTDYLISCCTQSHEENWLLQGIRSR